MNSSGQIVSGGTRTDGDEIGFLLTEEIYNVPEPELIDIDIKPQSCPNVIYPGIKGVLTVAILGSDDFDVSQVDPLTVQLKGVAPLCWSIKDVATSYAGDMEVCDIDACNELPGDGYLDLIFEFDNKELSTVLGKVSSGDCLLLVLTGKLKEEFGGTLIAGKDVVVIFDKRSFWWLPYRQ